MQGNWKALSSLKIKYKCYKYDLFEQGKKLWLQLLIMTIDNDVPAAPEKNPNEGV